MFVRRIVSPSSFEKKRDQSDRKESITEDNRTNVNTRKSNVDTISRPPGLKSLFLSFFSFQ